MVRVPCQEQPALCFGIYRLTGAHKQLTVPPIRHRLGDGPRPQIPLTYPSECLTPLAQIVKLDGMHLKALHGKRELTRSSSTERTSKDTRWLRRLIRCGHERGADTHEVENIVFPTKLFKRTAEGSRCGQTKPCIYNNSIRAKTNHIILKPSQVKKLYVPMPSSQVRTVASRLRPRFQSYDNILQSLFLRSSTILFSAFGGTI